MGKLTTHVLDTANGRPAAGMSVRFCASNGAPAVLKALTLNDDGRADAPAARRRRVRARALPIGVLGRGVLPRAAASRSPTRRSSTRCTLDFGLANADQHYHVPLLVSP